MTETRPGLPLSGLNVLIVEDRYLIARDLEEEVQKLGGRVVGPARSVESAHDLLGKTPVDLALLDINLEHELVFPLAETLSQAGRPFAFVTGYDEFVLPPEWRAWPSLFKPVNLRALRDQLIRLSGAAPAIG